MNRLSGNANFAELFKKFVQYKHLQGYKYSASEQSLARFVKFLSEYRGEFTKETVEEYILRTPNETAKTQSNRISDVRQFAIYLNERGYNAYVPPFHVFSNKEPSLVPYIFSHAEIECIIRAADLVKPHPRYNCAVVYPVLFRMLYCCGLRVSEALNLQLRDIDFVSGVLYIKAGKFGKDRLVPMTESLTAFCRTLLTQTHRHSEETDFFFKNPDGSKRGKGVVYERFRELLWESDIPHMGKGKGPRLHDLRHTFCCHTLKRMSDAGIDLYCALPVLSTYLGHGSIRATEIYLRLTAEFYPDVLTRMDRISSFVLPEVYSYEAD